MKLSAADKEKLKYCKAGLNKIRSSTSTLNYHMQTFFNNTVIVPSTHVGVGSRKEGGKTGCRGTGQDPSDRFKQKS